MTAIKLTGIRAVIIDLDGTMLHTAPDFHVAVNRVRADLGLDPLDVDTIVRFVGKGSESLIRSALGVDYSLEEVQERLAAAMASYEEHYLAINGVHTTVYQEVHEGLDALRAKGLRLACVTNKPIGFAVPLMKKMALHEYFDVIYGGDSLPRKKPDPMPLLQVFADFGVGPQQVVAIGDSTNDAQAARAAGCHVLTVPYGYNHGEAIQNVDSDGIVSSLLHAAHVIST